MQKVKDNKDYMLHGSVSGSIIKFAIPLFFGNLFQQLYNTADSLIVGNALGNRALAGVSATGMLIFLLVGFFQGIGIGAGVVISQFYGAGDKKNLSKAVHTQLVFSFFVGIFMTVFATWLSPWLLSLMDTPAEVMPLAVEYIRFYFLGSVGLVMYNSCMGIMQAVGDSRHPLYYLIVSSVVNIALDVVFVVFLDFGVWSAALATAISQIVSVVLCMYKLMNTEESHRVTIKQLRIDWGMLWRILRVGLPTGVQNSIIAFANVVVQSNINHFGEMAISGCGAYSRLEGFAFLPIVSFTSAITTFVGQNIGAGNTKRVKRGAAFGVWCSIGMAEVVGVLLWIFAPLLISAFTKEPDAIEQGVLKARTCALFFCLLAASHALSAVLRGAGRSMVPMFTMLAFWCVVRVAFLEITVPLTDNIAFVNWVYPLTWGLSTITLLIYYIAVDWSRAAPLSEGEKKAKG